MELTQLIPFVIKNWYLFVALVLVLAALLWPLVIQQLHRVRMLAPAQVVLSINRDNAVVVDVRDPKEFGAGHVVNALNLPLNDLPQRLSELNKYKQRPLVLNCRDGARAAKGAVLLRKQGFDNVSVLAGGLNAWERAQLPVEK